MGGMETTEAGGSERSRGSGVAAGLARRRKLAWSFWQHIEVDTGEPDAQNSRMEKQN